MTNGKRYRMSSGSAKQHINAKGRNTASKVYCVNHGRIRFRLLAFQPLSLTLEDARPIELCIQNIPCRLALRCAHTGKSVQSTHGGSFISLDFSLIDESDLLVATSRGLDLIDDFFSGVSLVEGVTFDEVEPIEIVRNDNANPRDYILLRFLRLSMRRWNTPIPRTAIENVQSLLAHWDGLDTGRRLRRAARQYLKAIGTRSALAAFQHAYMGLEALEKPLAEALSIPAGVEIIQGHCAKCGAEYTHRRTVLAGVRAYVYGSIHPETAIAERKQEWKSINELRHELFHSLADTTQLERKAQSVAPAAMHCLHDAICCLSHAHDLESGIFKLVIGTRPMLMIGRFSSDGLGPLEQCRPLLEVDEACWADHPQHGLVPEFRISNPRVKNLEAVVFWLDVPLEIASEENLVRANWESKQTDSGPKI